EREGACEGQLWPSYAGGCGPPPHPPAHYPHKRQRAAASPPQPNPVGTLAHGVIPGSSHTPALGISSPGIDKAHLMGPCNHGETQWNTTLDWTYRGGQDNGVPAEQRKPTSLPGRWRWCDRSWPCDARQSKTRFTH